VWDVDGRSSCDACGSAVERSSSQLASGLLLVVGVVYLATLAGLVYLFKAQPFVGGLAVIVTIAVGRGLEVLVKRPLVTRKTSRA